MTQFEELNEELRDVKGDQQVPWREKKMATQDLFESYQRLKNPKAYRVAQCGTYLEFKRLSDNSMKLHSANFCKVRLCPMCAWRRSLKIFAQVSQVMNVVAEDERKKFIFITLTCRNVEGDELSIQITNLFESYQRLIKRKAFKEISHGWFRALEITHNIETNQYHPHFHVILAVDKKYFTDEKKYLSHDKWVDLWKKSMRVDYNPIVDVRRVKQEGKIGKAIAEVAKYTVKESDFIIKNEKNEIDKQATDETVKTLDKALKNRRLVGFGDEFRQIQKQLQLDNMEDGDLVLTSENEIREDLSYVIEKYFWHVGYRKYIKK